LWRYFYPIFDKWWKIKRFKNCSMKCKGWDERFDEFWKCDKISQQRDGYFLLISDRGGQETIIENQIKIVFQIH
jgi:hypothetical protein